MYFVPDFYPDYIPLAKNVCDFIQAAASEIAHRKFAPLASPTQERKFKWKSHPDDKGRKVWDIDSLITSDTHLGSGYCLAEGVTLLLQTFDSNFTASVGDLYDRTGMRKRGVTSLSKWEEQVIAHLEERKTVYIDGNHEHEQTELTIDGENVKRNKWLEENLHGRPVYDAIIHVDAKGRRILYEHGDSHDGEALGRKGKALSYFIGDIVYTPIANMSYIFQHRLGLEKWAFALGIKKYFKETYKMLTGIQDRIWHGVDGAKDIHGYGHGHDHFGGFSYSPLGKIIVNPGTTGAECVQAQMIDDEGNRIYVRNLRKQRAKGGTRLVAEVREETGCYYVMDLGPYIPALPMHKDSPPMQYVKNTIRPNLKRLVELPESFGEPTCANERMSLSDFARYALKVTHGLGSVISAPLCKNAALDLPKPISLKDVPVFVSRGLKEHIIASSARAASSLGRRRHPEFVS